MSESNVAKRLVKVINSKHVHGMFSADTATHSIDYEGTNYLFGISNHYKRASLSRNILHQDGSIRITSNDTIIKGELNAISLIDDVIIVMTKLNGIYSIDYFNTELSLIGHKVFSFWHDIVCFGIMGRSRTFTPDMLISYVDRTTSSMVVRCVRIVDTIPTIVGKYIIPNIKPLMMIRYSRSTVVICKDTARRQGYVKRYLKLVVPFNWDGKSNHDLRPVKIQADDILLKGDLPWK